MPDGNPSLPAPSTSACPRRSIVDPLFERAVLKSAKRLPPSARNRANVGGLKPEPPPPPPLPPLPAYPGALPSPAMKRSENRSAAAAREFSASPTGKLLSGRSEEHTSELQSLMRISYAVFCLKKKKQQSNNN